MRKKATSLLCFVGLFVGGRDVDAFVFKTPTQRSLIRATSTSSSSLGVASPERKPRNDYSRQGNYKKKVQRNKPRQKTLRPDKNAWGPQRPPPDLTRYQVQTSPTLNTQRQQDAIDCPHFGSCSGCIVNQNVANTPILKSAALYFSSTAVRQHRTDVKQNNLPWAVEQANDGWMKVVVPSAVKAWRTQAKLAVAPASSSWASSDGVKLGLYHRGSHEVLEIPNCQVHHESINRAVQIIQECTKECRTAAFDENSREGGLRYVQLQVERTTGKVCLTLVWDAEQLKQTQPALSRIVKALQKADSDKTIWHSIWCHCNNSLGNAIFHRNPRRWHRLAGPEFVREPLPNTDGNAMGWLYFTPMNFRQGNLDGFSVLAANVAQAIPPGSKVCELYAGVGVLALTALAHHSGSGSSSSGCTAQPLEWIRCSDENPANSKCFARAVASLPASVTGETSSGRMGDRTKESSTTIDESEGLTLAELTKLLEEGKDPFSGATTPALSEPKTSYMVASAAQALRAGQALGANVLIVDPPRRGLEDAVLDELCKPFDPRQAYVEASALLPNEERVHWTNDVRTLIYVSCGFDALARDTERLLSSRAGWELESATGYVLFPGSDHVETVCVFQRQ